MIVLVHRICGVAIRIDIATYSLCRAASLLHLRQERRNLKICQHMYVQETDMGYGPASCITESWTAVWRGENGEGVCCLMIEQ